ncbi:MAG: flagellar basal body rod C-terminal domain-containing protein [Bdellovibrionales bacterium]|jgi:flagellar basal-body rod protein FlgC
MSSIFSSAISGMNAAATRFSNAVTNIVNASSTGRLPNSSEKKATSYQPTDVITLSNDVGDNHLGVTTAIIPRDRPYSVARDVTSPDANAEGLIAVPNVDLTKEIVDTMMAELAYKANAKVIAAAKRTEETLVNTLA